MKELRGRIAVATVLVALAGNQALAQETPVELPGIQEQILSLQGKPTSLATWVARQGRPVVISAWATWCGPCRADLASLSDLNRRHPGILMVGLAQNTAGQAEQVERLLAESGAHYPNYLDPHGEAIKAVLGDRDHPVIPAFAFFDAQGRRIAVVRGPLVGEAGAGNRKRLDALFQQLVSGTIPVQEGTRDSFLASDLASFYGSLARRKGLTARELLNDVASVYEAKGYEKDEVNDRFRALRKLVRRPRVAPDLGWVLFLNPTCSRCLETCELLREQLGADATPEIRFVGGERGLAIEAAQRLNRLQKTRPLSLGEVVTILAATVGLTDGCGLLGYLAELEAPEDGDGGPALERQAPFAQLLSAQGTPLVIYRGRLMARTRGRALAFDPLESGAHLGLTTRLIDLVARRR